jgi:hypothetical protein
VADGRADRGAALFLQLLKADFRKANLLEEAEMNIACMNKNRMVPCFTAIFFVLAMMLAGPSEAQLKLDPKKFCGKRS